jgi:hypothetical protein
MNHDQELREKILRYIQGEMNASEAHAFEKAMLEDPFLEDAVEGIQKEKSIPKIQAELNALDKRIQAPSASKSSRIFFYQMAAVFLIIVGTGIVILLRIQETKTSSPLAYENYPEKQSDSAAGLNPDIQQRPLADAPASNKDLSPTPDVKTIEASPQIAMDHDSPSEENKLEESSTLSAADAEVGASQNTEDFSLNSGAAPKQIESRDENETITEQLLAWANSLQSDQTARSQQLSNQSIEKKSNSKKSISQSPSASEALSPAGSPATNEINTIAQLIRNGNGTLAEQKITQYEKQFANDKSIYILKSALEFKRGNKAKAIQHLRSLTNTPYEKEAIQFENKINR